MECYSITGSPPALNSPAPIYTPGWREALWGIVLCLTQRHNTISPARARTRTTRSGVECTDQEATAPPTSFTPNTIQFISAIAQMAGFFETIPCKYVYLSGLEQKMNWRLTNDTNRFKNNFHFSGVVPSRYISPLTLDLRVAASIFPDVRTIFQTPPPPPTPKSQIDIFSGDLIKDEDML